MALQKIADKPTKSLRTAQKLSMADLLASGDLVIPTLKRWQEVRGRVVLVTPSEILVDIGAKSEGVISGKELDWSRDMIRGISVGQTIEATVVFVENDAGQVVLSLRKMAGESRWLELAKKKASGEEIEVSAVEVNRGGIICDFEGIRGFLPASQLAKTWSKLENLVGTHLGVGVIEVDRSTNRLIFSQKKLGGRELGDLSRLIKKVKIGEKYEGVVTAILPFGIFVEIEVGLLGNSVIRSLGKKKEPKNLITQEPKTQKLEGLVHISEISWEKVENPPELFKVGDKVSVMVCAKDEKNGRVNLSIKQLTHDPFGEISQKFSQNQKVGGTVARVTPYGVFVELEVPKVSKADKATKTLETSETSLPSRVEGLMHISKIPPNVAYKVGQEVECEIETIDVAARKISLVPIVREKPILYR